MEAAADADSRTGNRGGEPFGDRDRSAAVSSRVGRNDDPEEEEGVGEADNKPGDDDGPGGGDTESAAAPEEAEAASREEDACGDNGTGAGSCCCCCCNCCLFMMPIIRGGIGGALPLLDSDNEGEVHGIGEEDRPLTDAAAAACFALIAAISSDNLSKGLG